MVDTIVRRIAGLLAQAEATDNEAEAQTFDAAARRMMIEYAVDEATVRAAQNQRVPPSTEVWRYSPDARMLQGKQQLLAVACEMAGSGTKAAMFMPKDGPQDCALIGFEAERDVVKIVYTSLFVQGRAEANRQSFTAERLVDSFLVGFGSRLSERLEEAEAAMVNDAMALVLVGRGQEVDDVVDDMDLPAAPAPVVDEVAAEAGYEAANDYDLSKQPRLTP